MKKIVAAKMIDHTILKPDAQEEDILKLCEEAAEYGFASVCINPYYVPLAAEKLKGSSVKVCTVIGFPLGAVPQEVKAYETKWCVERGAREVDMVINIGALKQGRDDIVTEDIRAVIRAAAEVDEHTITKVIIEACLLTDEEKERAVRLCINAGAHFAKTSTGFSTGGATIHDVSLMKKAGGDRIRIKASGGVKDYKSFLAMVGAGADRVGTSNGINIISNAE